MRVLVVGTVPPPGGAPASALGRIVAQRLAGHDDVEVISPDLRSAAHRHARLSGLWLAIHLARLAPRFDALVLRIEPNLPMRSNAGRLERAACLAALGAVLRLYKHVTLRLDSPVPLPGGLGGRATGELWGRATTIVVQNDEDAKNLRAVPGVSPDRVVVEEPLMRTSNTHFDGWEIDLAKDVRTSVLLQVRARAERDRQVATAQREGEPPIDLSTGTTASSATRVPIPSVLEFLQFAKRRAMRLLRSTASR